MVVLQVALSLVLALGTPVPDTDAAADHGVQAYRAGDWALAQAEWRSALAATEVPAERARLAYDLGNAAFRMGETLHAVAWYTTALRLSPRDSDAWANLELARSEAGLEPADRGDLTDTLERLVSSMTLIESEWAVLLCLALFALCLAGEALRGGVVWRRLCLCAAGLVLLLCVPWCWNLAREDADVWMVVSERPAAARSEPRPDATRLTELLPGSVYERLDQLPGWVQVSGEERVAVWVRDHALFDLSARDPATPVGR